MTIMLCCVMGVKSYQGLGRVIAMMCVNTTVQCPVQYIMQWKYCCSLTDKSCCAASDQSGEEFAVTLYSFVCCKVYISVSCKHCTGHTYAHFKSVCPVHCTSEGPEQCTVV